MHPIHVALNLIQFFHAKPVPVASLFLSLIVHGQLFYSLVLADPGFDLLEQMKTLTATVEQN